MTETQTGIYACLLVGLDVIFAFLWMIGGRDNNGKFWRRYVGTTLFATGVLAVCAVMHVFSVKLLALYPALWIGTSNGYGGDTTAKKIVRRSIFTAGMLLSGVVCLWAFGFTAAAWTLFAIQCIVSAGSIVWGVKNPTSAPVEEVFICLLHTVVLCAYPFLTSS